MTPASLANVGRNSAAQSATSRGHAYSLDAGLSARLLTAHSAVKQTAPETIRHGSYRPIQMMLTVITNADVTAP